MSFETCPQAYRKADLQQEVYLQLTCAERADAIVQKKYHKHK